MLLTTKPGGFCRELVDIPWGNIIISTSLRRRWCPGNHPHRRRKTWIVLCARTMNMICRWKWKFWYGFPKKTNTIKYYYSFLGHSALAAIVVPALLQHSILSRYFLLFVLLGLMATVQEPLHHFFSNVWTYPDFTSDIHYSKDEERFTHLKEFIACIQQ